MLLFIIVTAALAGTLSVASPPNSSSRDDDCSSHTAAVCYERVLHHAIHVHPLYGKNETELEDTCKNMRDVKDCLEQYISQCNDKTDECDAECRDLIVRAEVLFREHAYLDVFEFLCDRKRIPRRDYLWAVECIYSLENRYASCRNTFQKSASYLHTKPGSRLEQCCSYGWYSGCLKGATKDRCRHDAVFVVAATSWRLMNTIHRECDATEIQCKSPPLPPEGDDDNKVCSIPYISNGRALHKFFLWNDTQWKQASDIQSIRDGQEFMLRCSDTFTVRDTGLQMRVFKCSEGEFDVVPECAGQCKVPHINNGIIRKPVKRRSTTYLIKVSEGEFIEDGEGLSLLCSDGYTFEGSEYRRMDIFCRQGKWSPEPHCRPVPSCGDPDSVSNALLVVSRVTFPNSVKYECEDGFEIRGTSTRYCQLDGLWSGRPPSCERVKSCVLETNSQVVVEPVKERYFLGDQVTFSCSAGKKLSNDVQRVMCMGESWMPHPLPNCVVDTDWGDEDNS